MRYNYIVIEGNIGAGKTSLASMLAERTEANLLLEEFADNPFLPPFYENPNRYAFPLELSFLAERYQQLKDKLSAPQDMFRQITISDYLFNKSLIFASINLRDDEFMLYSKLFGIINSFLPKPELLVYLHKEIPHLQDNIKKRGRSYEQNIGDDYLNRIQQGYWDFLKQQQNQRVVVIDTSKIDFVNNPDDFEAIINCIDNEYDIGITRVQEIG